MERGSTTNTPTTSTSSKKTENHSDLLVGLKQHSASLIANLQTVNALALFIADQRKKNVESPAALLDWIKTH